MSWNKVKLVIAISIILLISVGCISTTTNQEEQSLDPRDQSYSDDSQAIVNEDGLTILERFSPPKGYMRVEELDDSFGSYLRHITLKPHKSKVLLYDGRQKSNQNVHEAIFNIDVGTRDLQQCADAIMRLRAEFLRSIGRDSDIHFNFTNGFRVDYMKWMEGNRIKVDGNNTYWVNTAEPSNSYESFRKYLDIIFAYAGTLSLEQELSYVEIEDMQIGDVFVQGGSPGHAVIVVDMIINPEDGTKLFMLAQSYMAAQEIHILKNPNDVKISPWYSLDFGETLRTPEWIFTRNDLKRFE